MEKEIVLEGIKDILEILNFRESINLKVKKLLFFKKNIEKYKDDFLIIKNICIDKNVPILEISRQEFLKLKKTVNSTGIFLILGMKDYEGIEIEKILAESEKVLLLYNIQDPGNLGTIIRTAGLFGVNSIIIMGKSIKLSNSKVLRAIKGYFFGTKIIESKDDKFIFDILKRLDYKIFVADIGDDSLDIRKVDFTFEKKAFLFGSEGKGFQDFNFDFDKKFNKNIKKITIPLECNNYDGSLNLAVSCGIVLFEVNKYGRNAKINRFKE